MESPSYESILENLKRKNIHIKNSDKFDANLINQYTDYCYELKENKHYNEFWDYLRKYLLVLDKNYYRWGMHEL